MTTLSAPYSSLRLGPSVHARVKLKSRHGSRHQKAGRSLFCLPAFSLKQNVHKNAPDAALAFG